MGNLLVNTKDQQFLLFEQFGMEKIFASEAYGGYSKDDVLMILSEAEKMAVTSIFPTLKEGDEEGCHIKDGKVTVPKCFREPFKKYCEAGWINPMDSPDVGGQGLPHTAGYAVSELFCAANYAFVMYPGLTHGAANLINVYGNEEQKKKYMEKCFSGEWTGTMCLTEPGAGSDVGALKTTAKRLPDGKFLITGTKCFISAGDHDLTPNIIHPVLARIEGDPAGTKGISIFMVPKYRFNEKGEIGEFNDVQCGNIESKMGIHGNATCTLNFGTDNKCIGYLMGEEREGMPIMFHMMNEERQGVGMMGASLAGAAYLHALDYAKQRIQGANVIEMAMKVENPKPITIIGHPDVRRMLLKQKAIAEGCRLLCFFCYFCMDNEFNAMIDKNEEQQAYWHGFIELLTPIVKAYSTDMGMEACQLAVQTYGGYGFCREYPVEQMMRDQKINQIYEGTNGIQALDLLGRKLGMKKGLYFMNLMAMINETIAEGKKIDALKKEAETVEKALNACAETSMAFAKMIKVTPYVPLIGACDFLACMGDVIVGWLQLKQALVAVPKFFAAETGEQDKAFYRGKIEAARFFIGRITDLVPAKLENLKKDEQSCMNIPEESFAV